MSDNLAINVEAQADGTVVVNLAQERKARAPADTTGKFDSNLADDGSLSDADLSSISSEIMEGIDADIQSRTQWIQDYSNGLELLGLRIEKRGINDKTSTVRNPLLLWAIVKFQSLAQGEMLPANGPTKIRNDGSLPPGVADDLQDSMNWYLTTKAVEYYDDTDRGLFYLGYGGTIFKKIYRCPIRRRPVSECVYLPDLIVSQDAVNLLTANRVTHQISMLNQDVKRYQRKGHWRDIDLPQPIAEVSTTDAAEAQVTGVMAEVTRWQDQPRTICECYTRLDLTRWGGALEAGQEDGEELPYRVTIDKSSRQILEIRRNWKKDDPLRATRRRFVAWNLVPGIGFLALGYLHLLGNHTRALTGLERIILDGGMFANFPGGLRVKGQRQETNEIAPGPGEFKEIDTGGQPIQSSIMALPYKEPGQVMLALLQALEQQGEKLVGAIDIQTGDGATNVPVGTIMAQIEQATQIMTAVHKRLHKAQGEELQVLRELLCEEPEQLVIPGRVQKWTPEQLASASLVPASDPNVPAHVHRIMQAVVLETLSANHPELYDQYQVEKRILETARISDVDSVLHPPGPPPPAPPDPSAALAEAQVETAKIKAASESEKNQTKIAEIAGKQKLSETEIAARTEHDKLQQEIEVAKGEQEGSLAGAKIQQADQHHAEDLADKAANRASAEMIAEKRAATDAMTHEQDLMVEMDTQRLKAVTENQRTTQMAKSKTPPAGGKKGKTNA